MAAIGNRTIGLAGLYQSVDLVTQVAWRGQADAAPLKASLASILKRDAVSYEDVIGGASGIMTSLYVLRAQLVGDGSRCQPEHTRYAVILLHLVKKLYLQPSLFTTIEQGIARAREQLTHFELTHINVISRLADTYQRSIIELTPRIIVRGEEIYLSNPDNASRIRALLLAGIRAAVLWRQAGVNRWRLLVGRNAMLRDIEALLFKA
jgi:high frequency lysogenization protein